MSTTPPPRPMRIEEAAFLASLHHRKGRLEEAPSL